MEIEWVWVEFVGGPLDGQSRRLERGRTHYECASMSTESFDFSKASEPMSDTTATVVRYKIERRWKGKPGFHNETFKGVLV